MKRLICFILTAVISLSFITPAYADWDGDWEHDWKKNHKDYDDEDDDDEDYDDEDDDKHKGKKQKKAKKYKAKKNKFNYKKSPVIKYGRYKLPINPVVKGMDAEVDYKDGILTVTKDDITIVIDFKNETVTINSTIDRSSDIFKKKKNNGMTVLTKYIANILGIRVKFDDDEIIVENPKLDKPKNITVTPVGSTITHNTINKTTLYLTATADIKAGQATGGKAELYIGSKLVATDTTIAATDTTVTFSTSDGTPTNEELKNIVPKGGQILVKLYNSNNEYVTGKSNEKLIVDYVAPTITGITSASYDHTRQELNIFVTGASEKGDMVDVTRISLHDKSLNKTYNLTDQVKTGSSGKVKDSNKLVVNIGSVDRKGLTGFGGNDVFLIIHAGSILKDAAGNTSPILNNINTIPVTVVTELEEPANVVLTPIGSSVVPNTINSTTLYLTATASIKAGQAVGGRAELYVGDKLIAIDNVISDADTSVTFKTTANTNEGLKSLIPTGGVVSVKLYNAQNDVVVSKNNPTLNVDYIAPTLTDISSVIYNRLAHQLYFTVSGAGTTGDTVDVTMITIYDPLLGRSYQLTSSRYGSTGIVNSENSLVVDLGELDRKALANFDSSNLYISISKGSLIKDEAGNSSPNSLGEKIIPVIVIK